MYTLLRYMCEIMLIELMFIKTAPINSESYINAMKYMREGLHQNIH